MKRSTRSCTTLALIGSTLVAAGCSDDDDTVTHLGGAGGTSAAGSGGSSAGSGGSSAGSSGSGGTAGAAGSSGAAGAGGSSAGSGGSAGDGADAGSGDPDGGGLSFRLSSPAFDDEPGCGADDRDACDLFPDENTGLGDAENVSPALDWTGAPAGTQSFAIALHDLTFEQSGDPFTHWVMWNIPGTETGLPAELPSGVMPGVPAANTQQTSFQPGDGFAGSGACGNVYEFVLYALDTPTFTPDDPDDPDAAHAALDASDAVLATATLRARSDPNGPSCD